MVNKNWNDAIKEIVNTIYVRSVHTQLSTPEELFRFMKLRLDTSLEFFSNDWLSENSGLAKDTQLWYFLANHSINILNKIGSSISEEQVTDILIRKHSDYGPENILKFGQTGIIVRMYDKMSRLENLLKNSKHNFNTAMSANIVQDESIIDTLTDIVGYSAIGIMYSTYDDDNQRVFDYPMK